METAKYVIATNNKAYLFDTKKEADDFVFENHKAMIKWIENHEEDIARDGYKKILENIEKRRFMIILRLKFCQALRLLSVNADF